MQKNAHKTRSGLLLMAVLALGAAALYMLVNVDFENEKALVDDHILDSFDILQIISDISDEFDIVIPAAYVKPENFNSAEALWKMIQELQD